jgi:hypothetical protein
MKDLGINIISDDFIEQHVTDGIYRKIVKELSTAEDTKGRGRKIELTAEKLHNFLYYLSIGASYKLASESAQISENTRQKYMARSEEFRRVASLAKENVTLLALLGIHRAIAGRRLDYYGFIHPITKELTYILLSEVPCNARVAMWWLEQSRYFEKREEVKDGNKLGAPRNKEEARLLENLLNRHHDYVRSKEQEAK